MFFLHYEKMFLYSKMFPAVITYLQKSMVRVSRSSSRDVSTERKDAEENPIATKQAPTVEPSKVEVKPSIAEEEFLPPDPKENVAQNDEKNQEDATADIAVSTDTLPNSLPKANLEPRQTAANFVFFGCVPCI